MSAQLLPMKNLRFELLLFFTLLLAAATLKKRLGMFSAAAFFLSATSIFEKYEVDLLVLHMKNLTF